MTVSIGRIDINYYLSTAAGDGASKYRDLTAYYTDSGAPAGTWCGTGLVAIGMTSGDTVEKSDARSLYESFQSPTDGKALGSSPVKARTYNDHRTTPAGTAAKSTSQPVAGFDLTFSVPKSVSALWAIATPALQGRLHQAHAQAVRETLDWAEREVIRTRSGRGGIVSTKTNGVIASLFDHWDSRTGDPQLHTHAVILNRVQRASDGAWVTLDSYGLHRNVVAISERFNSLLFDRLYDHTGAVAELTNPDHSLDPHALQQALDEAKTQEHKNEPIRAELRGIPPELLTEFSTRSNAINAEADRLITVWEETHGRAAPNPVIVKLRQQATLSTRTAKDHDAAHMSLASKMAAWQERALQLGIDPGQIIKAATGQSTAQITNAMLDQDVIDQLGNLALTDTSLRRTTFTHANLIASAERITRGIRTPTVQEREVLIDRIVQAGQDQAVSLSPERFASLDLTDPNLTLNGQVILDRHQERIYTSEKTLADEALLVEQTTKTHPHFAQDPSDLAQRLEQMHTAEGHTLSEDQSAAAHNVLTDGKALSAIIGPAGTGKTTTMRAIKELWEQHSPTNAPVLGLAPSAVAAAVLGQEIQTTTENTAKWLYESQGPGAERRLEKAAHLDEHLTNLRQSLASASDRTRRRIHKQISHAAAQLAKIHAEHEHWQLRAGQLIIIDEASMVSTVHMAALARQAADAGAKILLVGDPQQLGSVDAGGFLGWMERNTAAPTLDQVWRFRADWERQASLRLREGDTNVLETYDEQGRIHASTNPAEEAFTAWLEDTADDVTASLLIAADNDLVLDLNQRAQLALVTTGAVSLEHHIRLRADAIAGIGDIVLARENDRRNLDDHGQFLKNGTRLRIESITDGHITARRLDTQAIVHLDASYAARSMELGYALTANRAQGATVETAHFVATEGTTRELAYVAMTRGRTGNHAYVATPEDEHSPDAWNLMHTRTPDNAMDTLAAILESSNEHLTATETRHNEHEKAHAYDRLISEYEWLTVNNRTQTTLHWLRQNLPETSVEAIVESAQWHRLATRTWPEQLPEHLEGTHVQIQDLLEISHEAPRSGPVGLLLPAMPPASPDHEQLAQALQQRIEHQLQTLTPSLTDPDKPAWAHNALQDAQDLEPAQQQELLKAITAWRTISRQDDLNPKPWGEPPQPGDTNMIAAWQSAHRHAPTPNQPTMLRDAEHEDPMTMLTGSYTLTTYAPAQEPTPIIESHATEIDAPHPQRNTPEPDIV